MIYRDTKFAIPFGNKEKKILLQLHAYKGNKKNTFFSSIWFEYVA